ncbi:MAG: hypothetical protein LBK69_00740 [Syntrophomonadaceae bacterium]|nr:hypothetical protein [Syntrophomonadaceae bacterium]
MKKVVFVSILILVSSLIVSCSTMYKGTAAAYWSSPYSIREDKSTDINGEYKYVYFLLYKNNALASGEDGIETIELAKMYKNNEFISHTIRVGFIGNKWRFMDNLQIKIDNNDVLTLEPLNKPTRDVISGSEVQEINWYYLSKDIVNSLKSCNALIIQNYDNPRSITSDGIAAMKEFLSE